MIQTGYRPVIELTRGDTVESIHYGALAAVDIEGRLVASLGDPQSVTFLRSSAKPFQALPFVEAGGPQNFRLTQKELALICASHDGTDEHVQVAASIQAKAGLKESDLMCGAHPSYHKPTAEAMLKRGEAPTPNRHNCSGKHSGMLAFAQMRGWPIDTYLEPEHGVQRAILKTFAEMCGLPEKEVRLGTDGCSAPNFAVPLYNAAWAWARLMDPSQLSPAREEACRRIVDAMTSHPDMVGGPGAFDTLLMQVTQGRILVKAGAEGYQGIGLRPGVLGEGSPALGIALKVMDGDGYYRARSAFTLETLRQLGALSKEEMEQLAEFGPRKDIYNWRKLVVGEMRPVFTLERHA
jgi:L-asparaginase II